jgi:hypothetical protein
MRTGLPKRTERAYLEAFYRHIHGQPSSQRNVNTEEVGIWMDAFKIADEIDISPWDALLSVVRRQAARVRWVDTIIAAQIEAERQEAEDEGHPVPPAPSGDVLAWMDTGRREAILLTRASKMALDAGVQNVLLQRVHLEGRVAVDALIAGLDVLELSQEDRIRAITAMHMTLTKDDGGPHNVIDVPPLDD